MKAQVLVTGRFFPRLASTVTLLESQGRRVLVDSGASEDAGRLVQALADVGLGPEDVDTVISTHLHYDHCSNHLLFTKADYLVSAADHFDCAAFTATYLADRSPGKRDTVALLRTRTQAIKDFYLRSIVREMARNLPFYQRVLDGDRRFVLLSGRHWLTDEIEIVPTPGHTPGHLSVVAHWARVSTEDHPVDLLIAGDALASRKAVAAGGEREVDLATDVEQYRRTRQDLLDGFRHIVPGHDTVMDTAAAVPMEAVS
jgi:glyoxylase-like metal-dependent hydrolase (beta-lactamase superfamily II)